MSNKYKYTQQTFPPQIPEMDFEPPVIWELHEKTNKQLMDFSALLDTFSSLEEKKKLLWKQIYENAVTDRKNAYILFGDLYKDVRNEPTQHAIHGVTLTKYLERMEKSNNQLLKLAELIEEVSQIEEEMVTDEDNIYDQMDKNRRS